jgi:hypothetical protein
VRVGFPRIIERQGHRDLTSGYYVQRLLYLFGIGHDLVSVDGVPAAFKSVEIMTGGHSHGEGQKPETPGFKVGRAGVVQIRGG